MELEQRPSGTVAPIPTRPQPKALQLAKQPKTASTDESSGLPTVESGSSNGGQTSGSFVLLPPGAKLPDVHQLRLDLPPLELMNPPQRRLSRPPRQKPLPPVPMSPEPTQNSPPPSSWAVPFRGFVKAVRWTRSSPQLKTRNADTEKTKKGDKPPKGLPQMPNEDPITEPPPPRRNRLTSISLRRQSHSGAAKSNNGTPGVFLVPHVQHEQQLLQSELRPPSSGWMRPVAVDPLEFSTARTVIGHSSSPASRVSLDGILNTYLSPPLADLPTRKSVSEIGHGSVLYAPLSPEASYSTIGDFQQFPTTESPTQSRDLFPPTNVEIDNREPESQPPPPPKSRLEGIKRALSFKRPIEHKSTSDIPSLSNVNDSSLPRYHRSSKSADIERPVLEMPPLDKDRPNRLRRQSVLIKSRNNSPSRNQLPPTPKFMLSPDASLSSILSTPGLPTTPSSIGNTTPKRSASTGRRLVKRKPSENKKSSLPATLEVETPKSLEIPNPMESLVLPSPPPRVSSLPPVPPIPAHIAILPTPDTPGLPLSAPIITTITKPLPAIDPRQKPTPPIIALPTPPSEPWSVPIPTVTTPRHGHTSSYPPRTPDGAPPSAMRDIRPPMPHRPSLERRASRRRWTLNIAAQDIDDEALKAELERLKALGDPTGNVPDSGWTLAKKALLSARELILTERTYLDQMSRFLDDVTLDSGHPPLLMKHLPILVSASQAFCNRMQEDPSAWGVSAAFVTVEAVLEQVFVDYCQVVGQIMHACQQTAAAVEQQKTPTSSSFLKHTSLSRSKASIVNGAAGAASDFGRKISNKSSEKVADSSSGSGEKSPSTPVSAWHDPSSKSKVPRSKSMPGKDRRKSMPIGEISMTPSEISTSVSVPGSAATTPGSSPTHRRGASLASGRARAITAADIAIAPPQRVTRYVMLFKDLLNGTPLTAPSRPLVQRALDGALRIAENCDQAQGDLSLMAKKKA